MAETERNNLPIAEEPEFTTEIPAIRPDDLVHFTQMNAMLESLLGNDVFLQRLANKMIENSLIAHVLDCENSQMVLGADQGPAITGLIDEVNESVTQLYSDIQTLMEKVFPDIKYLIQSGVMMMDSWTWTNTGEISGNAYNNGNIYCLSVTVSASVGHGAGIKFSSPGIETDGLSTLQIDFEGISHPDYIVLVNIRNQSDNTLVSENVSVQGVVSKTYTIPSSATSIILSITVSMGAGTNILKIRNMLLF